MLVEANAFFGKTRTAATTYGLVIPEDSPNTGPDGDFEIDGYMNLGKSEFLPSFPFACSIIQMGKTSGFSNHSKLSLTDFFFAQRITSATPLSTSPKSATSPRRRTSTSLRICMSFRLLFLLASVLVRFEGEKNREKRRPVLERREAKAVDIIGSACPSKDGFTRDGMRMGPKEKTRHLA
jgi:hypothetical protein